MTHLHLSVLDLHQYGDLSVVPLKIECFLISLALHHHECYPDTFAHDWSNARHVTLLKSGQTCIDYSLSGPYFRGESGGRDGKTGWMFVKQVDPILTIQPTAFVLEMVSSAAQVHDGSEVDEVCSHLSKKYHVHKMDRLRTWTMGDVSNPSFPQRTAFRTGMVSAFWTWLCASGAILGCGFGRALGCKAAGLFCAGFYSIQKEHRS